LNLFLSLETFAVFFGLLMIAMIIHEFAHAYAAYKLGDTTAKYSGRLTFNPLAHIDIFWTVLLPLLFFITTGMFIAAAKPVPINYRSLRNPKRDMVLIGSSGPLANLMLALILSLALKVIATGTILSFFVQKLIYINIMLGIFNLIPIITFSSKICSIPYNYPLSFSTFTCLSIP